MVSRPRSSLLDLFDPLLAEAIRVPIPESPPSTPGKPSKLLDCSPDNKENVVPKELTMSVFFNRISNAQHFKTSKDEGLESGLLVDFTDTGVPELRNETGASPPRKPLTELSVDDLVSPNVSRLVYDQSKEQSRQKCRSLTTPTSDVSRTSPAGSYPIPVISVSDSPQHTDSASRPTSRSFQTSPLLPKDLQRRRGPAQDVPYRALMPPPSSSHRIQQRRHSSLDNSMTPSSMSSSSFNIPDASFDLVNGEISFLSKSSLEEDVNEEVLLGQLGCETPMIRVPPQKMIVEESPLKSLGRTQNHRDPAQVPSSLLHTILDDNNNEQNLGHVPNHERQRTLSTISNVSTSTVRNDVTAEEPNFTQVPGSSPVSSEGQDTPLRARRLSSVPAPTKKFRVFTSNHQRAVTALTTQFTHDKVPNTEDKPMTAQISKTSEEVSTGSGPGTSMGRAKRVPLVGNKSGQLDARRAIAQKPLSVNPTVSNIGAVPTAIRPPSSSMLRKPNPIPHVQRTNNPRTAISRLPGPVVARGSSLPKPASISRLPPPSQRNFKGRDSSVPSAPSVSSGRFSKV